MENTKSKSFVITMVISVFIIMLIPILLLSRTKGTYSAGTSSVELDCPATAAKGATVTCNVKLNVSGSTILSVNANYKTYSTNGIKPSSYDDLNPCPYSQCFETLAATTNGFATVNTTGVSSTTTIGTVTVAIPSNATSNTNYKVGLTNVELCDDEYQMISLADVEDTIRVLNNDATLSNLSLSTGSLNETFASTTYTYTATVASSVNSLTVTATKSDSGATFVTGAATNTMNLHYGTNTLTIKVKSEDESTTKTYTLTVTRQYDFSYTGNDYVYNSTGNYLYTKRDTNSTTIISKLPTLESNMSYAISDNKLNIKYGTEVVKSIDIVNFTIATYDVNNTTIYLGSSVTYQTIKSKITSSTGLIFSYLDSSNATISNNSRVMVTGDKVQIKKSSTVLETYTFDVEYLTLDSSLKVDADKMIIKQLTAGTTLGTLKGKINTSGTISVQGNSSATNSYELKTGDVVVIQLRDSTISYTMSIVGCLGTTTTTTYADVIKVYAMYNGTWSNPTDAVRYAGDINNDNQINFQDVILIYAMKS